jgi:NADPH2:quinone reductase
MKAVYIEQPGGLDALCYGDQPTPEPKAGEVLVKLAAAGVNFIDTYHRSGLYKLPLPAVLGSEGAGTVERVGEGVTTLKAGDRVAYAMARGSYAEYAVAPASLVMKIPADVEFRQAAAIMLQGMTAHYLSHSTFPLKAGHTALIHAAAGGTGRLLVQMAAMLGARVIATAGTEAKAELARSAGAGDVILYDREDWVAVVKKLTDGKGVDVVYDSVGQATFLKGFDCLKTRGTMVFFGHSSGPVLQFDPLTLMAKGSLYLTRPTLGNYVTREEIEWRTKDLFGWIAAGKLDVRIDKEYPLADAAAAHRYLEGRNTTGKLILRV